MFGAVFVEHKDLFGLTIQAQARNLLGARDYFRRTVYDGPRPDAGIHFTEFRDRRIGPIFRLVVSGDF